ncbi:MAG: hypothetical protein ACPHK6_09990, partial [Ilumatobacteraceae bacterium]
VEKTVTTVAGVAAVPAPTVSVELAASTIAATATVPAPAFEVEKTVTTVAGVGAVPAPELVVDPVVSVVNAVASVDDVDLEVELTATTIAGVGAVPAPTPTVDVESSTVQGVAGVAELDLATKVSLPTTSYGSTTRDDSTSHIHHQLYRHFTARTAERNIYILDDGTATTQQPHPITRATRILYGGHEVPGDLTPAEVLSLTAAGFAVEVS